MAKQYKAKVNVFCDGKRYTAGELYSADEIKGLDPNDFDLIIDESKPDKPKTKKGKSK